MSAPASENDKRPSKRTKVDGMNPTNGAPAPPGPPPGPPPAPPKENPYLSHLPPGQRFTGNGVTANGSGDPLEGMIPRKVLGAQALAVMEGEINAFRSPAAPFSQRYKEILAARKKLPVFAQMDEFYEKFNSSQIMVMIGETGSGKTTQ